MKIFYDFCLMVIGISFIFKSYSVYSKGMFIVPKYGYIVELGQNSWIFSLIFLLSGIITIYYTFQSVFGVKMEKYNKQANYKINKNK